MERAPQPMAHTQAYAPTHVQGFTLIEILVGIALGVVVLGAIIAVFIPTLQTWQVTRAHAWLQDTEQILDDVFNRSIRPASRINCGTAPVINGVNAVNPPPWNLDFANTIVAISPTGNTTATVSGENSGYPIAQRSIGDALVTLHPDGQHLRAPVAGIDITDPTTIRALGDGLDIRAGNYYLVHDCTQPLVVSASAASDTSLRFVPDPAIIGARIAGNSIISGFIPAIYYVNGVALSQTTQTGTQSLLNGIINMRVELNVGGNWQTIDQTAPAGSTTPGIVNDFSNISVVRLNFLLETPTSVNQTPQGVLSFPDINGIQHDCGPAGDAGAENYNTACPASMDTSRLHRVVSFVYDLPK